MPKGKLILGDCQKVLPRQPSKSVDLVIGSPPYALKTQRYGTGQKMTCNEWVEWMYGLTVQAVRISRNVVVWVANGAMLNGYYQPACEGLIWQMYSQGYRCERPMIWHKNSSPNRGKDWPGNDWEFCMAFRPADSTGYYDWESIAQPSKYKAGGQFRQRNAKGERKLGNLYPQGKLARPRDVIGAEPVADFVRATVGGGHMGSKLASEGEAPYPEKLIVPFLKLLVPPGGTVLDPFVGSGTTISVAEQLGLNWIGIENRKSQLELCQRRIKETREKMKGAAGG